MVLYMTVSEITQTVQGSESEAVSLQEIFKQLYRDNSSSCTWMGETAAAGAVRTGIPLRGLLGEEGI